MEQLGDLLLRFVMVHSKVSYTSEKQSYHPVNTTVWRYPKSAIKPYGFIIIIGNN